MEKEIFKTDDGEFTFEEGKSYSMKYKLTTVHYIWEADCELYRTEYSTSKNHSYEGYIITKQLPERYSWHKNVHERSKSKSKFMCRELTGDELKKLNADFNTWEVIEQEKREAKRKAYGKRFKKN